MGGNGKTTLAQLIFNSVELQKGFEIKMWVPVGTANSDVTRVAKAIVERSGSPDSSEFRTGVCILERMQAGWGVWVYRPMIGAAGSGDR
ncbi:putative P-loop containing nucleoside triphosphate hydrolase [Helianthus anomalus]